MKSILLLFAVLALLPNLAAAQQRAAGPVYRRAGYDLMQLPPIEDIAPGVVDSSEAELTLDELVHMALANNPTLAHAAARVQALRGTWVQEGLYPNPRIGYSADEIGNEGTAGFQGGFISQELVTGGKLRLGRATAGQAIRAAEQDLAAQEMRVRNDVRIAFHEALAAQRMLDLNEKLLPIEQQSLDSAEKAFKAQEVSRVDVLQTQIARDRTRIEIQQAQARQRSAMRRLGAVTGGGELPAVRLAGELEDQLPQLYWETSLARLEGESPELTAALARVDEARWMLEREIAQRIPNVEVMAGLQHSDASGDLVTNVEVSVPVPLFNKNQGNIQRAEAELMSAQADVERIRLDLHARLAAAFERYEIARQQAEQYSTSILPNAQASLNLVRQGREAGEFPLFNPSNLDDNLTLLGAQRTYFQARLAHIQALQELHASAALIEGLLLSGSLEQQGR